MAHNIMLQGTMSGVGKSLMTAALCRIFLQDGYSVAPFKSQNMALNSYVTKDGLEMGRAQVLQAFASGKEPDIRMNPILLKPSDETGSQVIVNGKVRGDYKAGEYFRLKEGLKEDILKAYESLEKENDIVVIEGAGSPAEINLKKGKNSSVDSPDIVNMGLAEMVDAPVILIGDIDPGGVFAQLYGTVMLLGEDERKRIKGIFINKFRGDRTLLEGGLRQIEDITGIPVLGVIPYTKVYLDEEDSLSERLKRDRHDRLIDVAVIRMPFISNYTDLDPLDRSPLTGVRYVDRVEDLKRPDVVILPGSKNTVSDLKWLKSSGIASSIRALSEDTMILGICGGFQMLGNSIYDEKTGECEEGLGLLNVKTVFKDSDEKVRRLSKAKILDGIFKDLCIEGYEIHMGMTGPDERSCNDASEDTGKCADECFCMKDDGNTDGFIKGDIIGTYIHGLFDNGSLIPVLEDHILKKRGLKREMLKTAPMYTKEPEGKVKITDHNLYREEQIDLLADTVRKNADMDAIYRIMGLRG
ncbi:MAG: cobyric acid synthase [Lachnospiraceae bacterium]|nr:cobyric acid synthase [Lachnospiraceae bacterium]